MNSRIVQLLKAHGIKVVAVEEKRVQVVSVSFCNALDLDEEIVWLRNEEVLSWLGY
jgi:hypothetical protein